jgi:hypothetical protein
MCRPVSAIVCPLLRSLLYRLERKVSGVALDTALPKLLRHAPYRTDGYGKSAQPDWTADA